jgi:hypothetical protein
VRLLLSIVIFHTLHLPLTHSLHNPMATFSFTYDPGTTVQQMLGMEIAGRIWSRYLTDNTTINIHVGIASDLGSNIIGGALPGMRSSQSYQTYRTALNNGPKSADDTTAIGSLSNTTSYTTNYAYINNSGDMDVQAVTSSTLNMTRAVAKAAGISLTDGSTALDGYILFSNLATATANGQAVRWSYDYTRSSTQAANTLDFLSTAIHEIGHVLGFVSGVDQPGLYGIMTDWNSTPDPGSTSTFRNSMSNRVQYTNPLDLFRYSAAGVRNISHGEQFNKSEGVFKPTYFSLNNGSTSVADFANGLDISNYGDGYQASHWRNGTAAIMNPTLSLNTRRNVSALDLRAMDVIGWDIASTGINTTINLSDLQTQSRQALATRAGQTTTWITNNSTASPTALVANRDTQIYTMMQNSVVYDMTRVTAPSSTGWTTRQTLAQVFQQRSLFSTVDELDGFSDDRSGLGQPTITVVSERIGDLEAPQTAADMPSVVNAEMAIAVTTKILPFYRANFTAVGVPTSSSNNTEITIEVAAQPVKAQPVQAQNTDILSGNYETAQFRAYGSRMQNQIATANATEKTDNVFSLDQILHLDRAVF